MISVGADNTYGHPDELPLSRLRDAGVTVYRTDEQGTILVTTDGKDLTFSCGNDMPPAQPEAQLVVYIGNRNSKTLHRPDCGSLPKEGNRVYFLSRLMAELTGYRPCSQCMG